MRPAVVLMVISLLALPIKAQQQPEQNPPAQQTIMVRCRDMQETGEYLAPDEVIIEGKACRPASTQMQPSTTKQVGGPETAPVTAPIAAKPVTTSGPATTASESEETTTPATLSAPDKASLTESGSAAYVKCGVGETEVYLLSSPTGPSTVVSTLKCGDKLLLLTEEKGWYKAQTGEGTVGYISRYFIGYTAGSPVVATPAAAENPRPVMSNLTGFQYTVTFVILENGHAVSLMPNWAIKWVKKNQKHYPGVRFSTSDPPIPRANNFVIAFSASPGAVQGFEPVTHTDASTSTTPVSGSGTVTDNQGEMWNYTYDGTVTTTTTTTTEEQVPYTETSNTLYVTAFNEQGHVVSQRWHVFSSRAGGNPYYSLGYNLGSALSAINARGNLLKSVVDAVVPRK